MTTPLIILALLFIPFLVAKLLGWNEQRGGLVGLVAAWCFFGIGHFAVTGAMAAMLPEFVPARVALIYATGLWEFALAAGLALPQTRRPAAIAALATLVLFFPANIFAAINATGPGGHQWGPIYLLIRAPLQAVIIYCTWRFGLKQADQSGLPSLSR